jgi:hypothetical protein
MRAADMLLRVRDVQLGQRDAPWQLARAATIAMDSHGLRADSLEIHRGDGGRVRAAGRIAWHDESHTPEPDRTSDFRLDFEGVPFAEFALATTGVAGMSGMMRGHVRVAGNAAAPLLDGETVVSDFRIGAAQLDRVSGSFTYAGRNLRTRLDGENGGRRVLFADGALHSANSTGPCASRFRRTVCPRYCSRGSWMASRMCGAASMAPSPRRARR